MRFTLSQTTSFRTLQNEGLLQTTILNFMKIAEFYQKVENTVGKEEIAKKFQNTPVLTLKISSSCIDWEGLMP